VLALLVVCCSSLVSSAPIAELEVLAD